MSNMNCGYWRILRPSCMKICWKQERNLLRGALGRQDILNRNNWSLAKLLATQYHSSVLRITKVPLQKTKHVERTDYWLQNKNWLQLRMWNNNHNSSQYCMNIEAKKKILSSQRESQFKEFETQLKWNTLKQKKYQMKHLLHHQPTNKIATLVIAGEKQVLLAFMYGSVDWFYPLDT